jgi:sugar lactone lactonase YvrE
VQRLQNTNCSPLINYKNTAVINPPSQPSSSTTPTTTNYTIGGTVSGLPNGQSLTLLNNNPDSITLSANGNFVFNNYFPANSNYAVTLGSMPSGYNCTVQNGTGKVSNSNINNIQAVCSISQSYYSVGGTLSGLDAGQTITISNNNNDSITLSANGAFNFSKPILSGSSYFVSIQQEPDYKLCKVSQGGGTGVSKVTNVSVDCLSSMVDDYVNIEFCENPMGDSCVGAISGIAIDSSANLYVGDDPPRVRKITPTGLVTTIAGSGFGQMSVNTSSVITATFGILAGSAIDSLGNLYLADVESNVIRKMTPSGVMTTLAGSGKNGATNGSGTQASFSYPQRIAVDPSGNVYVADSGNNLIRKVTPAGVVTTLAGSGAVGSANGTGIAASFGRYISSIAVDASGNVYVADGNLIQKVDASGNVYIANGGVIRKITPAGVVTTLAGSGEEGSANGTGIAASFGYVQGISVDASGNVYVADTYRNHLIRKITPAGVVTTLAGSGAEGSANGTGIAASFGRYSSTIAVDASGNVFVADYDAGNTLIRKVTPAGVVTTLHSLDQYYSSIAVDASGDFYAVGSFEDPKISKITKSGIVTTLVSAAIFSEVIDVAVDSSGNVYAAGFYIIRKITPTGAVSTLAGSGAGGSANGTGIAASFNEISRIAADASGNVYVADLSIIRKITPAGVVTTLAGGGPSGDISCTVNGTGTQASFCEISSIAADALGNVYVAEGSMIRKITPAGVVTTLAGSEAAVGSANGTGTQASFSNPLGIAVDPSGNVYVADSGNNLIRKVTPAGVVTTIAGSGESGTTNGKGKAASFDFSRYDSSIIKADSVGNLYVLKQGYGGINPIRKITFVKP